MTTPWRTGMPGRPDVAVPPAPMSLFRGRRPLKRWRWVGAFSDELMLCAAVAHIGPLPVSWWAVWDRGSRTPAQHTVKRVGPGHPDGPAVRIQGRPGTPPPPVHAGAGVATGS